MKKIMFSDRYGLTEAVLSGRKTMTRRVATLPTAACLDKIEHAEIVPHKKYGQMAEYHTVDTDGRHSVYRVVLPFKVGDVVAVAQRYANDEVLTFNAYDGEGQPRKDGHNRHQEMLASEGYRNKMFVRADLMPHRIRITDLWFERLQDISDEDAMREGIRQSVVEYGDKKIVQWTYFGEKITTWFDSPRAAFAALIDRICGRGTWKRNPWAVAYEFELIKKEG